jgi:hypothetical protein
MKLSVMALALSTLCLATSACETTKRTADFLPTPANRLVCDRTGTRPTIPAEYSIDWAHVATVAQAKAEHMKYVASIRTREGIIAAYVLKIEGVNFVCFNNMQWRRDFEADLAKTHPPTP